MKKCKFLLLVAIAIISISNAFGQVYEIEPNLSNCTAGKFSAAEITRIVDLVNDIRAHHKIAPFTWNYDKDTLPQSAALSIVATDQMSHAPVAGQCSNSISDEGRAGSNLMYGGGSYTSESCIIGWLKDNNNVSDLAGVGHRRLVLNPFLKTFAYGMVTGNGRTAAAFWGSLGDAYNFGPSTCENDFIAYPYENYPINWFLKDFYLSFNPLASSNTWYPSDNAVNFSNTKITIKDSLGNNIAVTDVSFDYEGKGILRNNISWKAAGLKDSTRYMVSIKGTVVNGATKDYEYWFKLTNEPIEPPEPLAETPVLVLPINNDSNIEAPVNFKWKKSLNAEYYDIRVSTMQTFADSLDEEAIFAKHLTDTTWNLTKTLFSNFKYYWKVTAYNIEDMPTESETWTFETKEIIPDPPVTIHPAENDVDIVRRGDYIWTPLDIAEYYNIQISKDATFNANSVVVSQEEIYEPTYTLTSEQTLESFTSYYWRVNAYLLTGSTTEWSTPTAFNTSDIISGIEEVFSNGTTIACYPNPFSSNSTITINVNAEYPATIEIYNLLGIKIAELFNGNLEAGNNTFNFNTDNLLNGVYFCKTNIAGNFKVIPLTKK